MHTGTGGGHTSAAKAVIEVLEAKYSDKVECELVDAVKEYAPKPLDMTPEAYSQMLKAPHLYRQLYEMGDGKRRSQLVNRSIALATRRNAKQLLNNHTADVVVSTYHLLNAAVANELARRGHPSPLISIVTDLVSVPPVWFHPKVDWTVVPTESAYHQALKAGMPQERVQRLGLPVSPRFKPATDKAAVRKQLGWPTGRKIVLVMAGGAGVGPLSSLGKAIVEDGLAITPVLITGKNRRLAANLRKEGWSKHALIYDYVDDMHAFMQAADIIITKAGSLTISEALNANLPIIIYHRVPGQEEGNVEYVSYTGAGYWAPNKGDMITTLRYLITDPTAIPRATAAAKHLSYPKAAEDIAKLIVRESNQVR